MSTPEVIRLPGGTTIVVILHASAEVTLLEVTLERGTGPGLHRHSREHELVYVLEGELEVEINGQRSVITAEGTTFFPLGSVHRFAASPNARVRAIFICVPGGLERFFRAFAFDPPLTDAIAASGVESVVPL
jgi:quercetin dioxygenase-like cupin family protein